MSIRLFRPFFELVLQAYENAGNEVGTKAARLIEQLSDRWDFKDPETRLPYGVIYDLLQASIEDTGDPTIGLHAAELVEPQDVHVVYYACSCCANLGEAAETLTRYFALLNETAVLSLRVQGDTVLWTYRLREGIESHYASIDFVLASVLIATRRLTGVQDTSPLEVRFTYPEPEELSEYRRVFGVPLKFNALDNGFLFPTEGLGTPLPGADAHLFAVLQSHAERIFEELPRTDRFSDRIRELVLAELCGGNPNLEHIADKLAISGSTLRRRLADEGTTHRELLDELRRNLALRYLDQEGLIISEIAFLLGFSHDNAFRKAFQRWTGKSPTEFRQRQRTNRREFPSRK